MVETARAASFPGTTSKTIAGTRNAVASPAGRPLSCREELPAKDYRERNKTAGLIRVPLTPTSKQSATITPLQNELICHPTALAPIDAARARDILEILDDRFGHRSVIVTSQLPVADWHRQVKDPSVADAILDRLVDGAIRFELHGESMRNPAAREPAAASHP